MAEPARAVNGRPAALPDDPFFCSKISRGAAALRQRGQRPLVPAAGAPRPVLMAGPFALERPRGLAVIVSCPVQRGGRHAPWRRL